jgi:hypothetical protein
MLGELTVEIRRGTFVVSEFALSLIRTAKLFAVLFTPEPVVSVRVPTP